VVLMVYFVFRFRRKPGESMRGGPVPTHHTALELTWTIVPFILVSVIFYLGFAGFMDLTTAPQNSYEIQVSAQRWKWTFIYPSGSAAEDPHPPADVPVKLTMTSSDVIHGFFVPDFRIKHDVVPGRYNMVWFKAKAGTYDIMCTQY